MSASVECPNCDQEITDELSEVENEDIITCPHCDAELQVNVNFDGDSGDEEISLSILDISADANADEEDEF